jgi:hypothetical protein
VENKESVSQIASFTFTVKGEGVTLDFHHLTGTGQIHLGLRRQHQAPETEEN